MYELEELDDGSWAVIDQNTGEVAVIDGLPQVGLEMIEADDLICELNGRGKPATWHPTPQEEMDAFIAHSGVHCSR